jgi:alkyl sulfatase BDS1-like metallo-beta-lactamase superfamily hydrolase
MKNVLNVLKSKRFVVRKSLIGKNQIITFTNKKGDEITYNHDKVFEIMKESYTATNNIPMICRGKELV